MIRLLLACCLLMATITNADAQQGTTAEQTAQPTVSKVEYSKKVAELNMLIKNKKSEEAEKMFHEITQIAYAHLGNSRAKIRTATNEEDKKKYAEATMQQREQYATILKLKANMTENRKEMIEKMNEFSNNFE
jgi:hypothetical protein